MFTTMENHALLRLMRLSTGHVPDSRPVAYWLQEWECSHPPQAIKTHVPGLTTSNASDVKTVAQAANRTGAKPSTLGRLEYRNNMENIARIYPLHSMEYDR